MRLPDGCGYGSQRKIESQSGYADPPFVAPLSVCRLFIDARWVTASTYQEWPSA
jgi:hypothetical protein